MRRAPTRPAPTPCAALALLLTLLLPHTRARADAADPKTTIRPAQVDEPVSHASAVEAAPPTRAACPQHCMACTSLDTGGGDRRGPSSGAEREATGRAHTVDLNKADESALLELPGIGPARARAILAYRVSHGAFHSIAQLLHIKGIGRALLKQLRPLVTLSAGPA